MTETLTARLRALHPEAKLIRRDITAEHLPHLDDITLPAISTKDPTEAVLLFLWIAFLLIIVRPARVWDAGVAYAERLLASLPAPSAPKPKGRAPKGGTRQTLKS